MLNLPVAINKKFEQANNILIVGIGGGSDVLAGLPLYYTLLKQGKKVHFANITATDFKTLSEHADPVVLGPTVLGATPVIRIPLQNYVEGYLSQYFQLALKQDHVVWMISKSNVQDTRISIEALVDHLKIDGVILVDSGLDSLMTGEEGKTFLTNKFVDVSIVLAAIQESHTLQEKSILMSCNNNSKAVNKNLGKITLQGGFYGGCYILSFMNSYKLFRTVYDYEKNNQNSLLDLEMFVKCTEQDFDDELKEEVKAPYQLMFFNPMALAYNNAVIHKILDAPSYYDIIQLIAPFITLR